MLPSTKSLRVVAALLGAAGVILGAFGAHALRDSLAASQLSSWQTAVQYLFWHAIAALALMHSTAAERAGVRAAVVLFVLGTIAFSGSLFALALSGPRWLGPVTPMGGLLLISGWLMLAWTSRRD